MRYLELAELEELSAALSNAESGDGTRLSCRIEAYSCKAAGADKKLLVQLLRRYRDRAAGRRRGLGHLTGESGTESSWEDVLCGGAGDHRSDSLESLVRDASHDSLGPRARSRPHGAHIGAGGAAAEALADGAEQPANGLQPAARTAATEREQSPAPLGRRRHSLQEGRSRSVTFRDDAEEDVPDAVAELPPGMSLKALYYLVATINQVFPDYDLVDVDPRCFVPQPDAGAVMLAVDAALGGAATASLWDPVSAAIGPLAECAVYTFDPRPTHLSVLDDTDDPFWERGYLWSLNYFFYNRRLKRVLLVAVHAVSVLGLGADDRPSQRSLTPIPSAEATQ